LGEIGKLEGVYAPLALFALRDVALSGAKRPRHLRLRQPGLSPGIAEMLEHELVTMRVLRSQSVPPEMVAGNDAAWKAISQLGI
jgi:hypothetical protein